MKIQLFYYGQGYLLLDELNVEKAKDYQNKY